MKSLRETVGENLTELRKNKKITQLELAEKLNYSDKSISKWEKGDAIPDIDTLYDLCQFYGVTLDYLTTPVEQNKSTYVLDKDEKKRNFVNHILITVFVDLVFWFLATIIFVYAFIKGREEPFWLSFIYCIPFTCLITAIFAKVYFSHARVLYFVLWSVFIWSLITSIFLTILQSHEMVWPIYLVGIPAQGALVAWFFMRKK